VAALYSDNAFRIDAGTHADCNANGQPDEDDILGGTSDDCNGNGRPDECEIDAASAAPGGPYFCHVRCAVDCDDNGVPDECEPDCNANGITDACDIAGGAPDCNANGVPDACENDCNCNGIDDADDIANLTSGDCNGNGVPDECDLAAGSEDCNGNTVPDECENDCNCNGLDDLDDIASGTSLDCDGNTIPDACDIANGTHDDCNDNTVPDVCDIVNGTSLDNDGDGRPDECCALAAAPVFVEPLKSRYISIESVGTPGVLAAIRVRFVSLDGFPTPSSDYLWVGPPREYPDPSMEYENCMITAANLSCTPHYHDWSTIGVLHIFGAEVVPSSTYAVQLISEGCPDTLEANYSDPVLCETGKWGDTSPLYASPANPPQPDFGDIAGAISAFLGRGGSGYGAAGKVDAQLQPNVVLPDRPVNFKDIAAVVTAFLGTPYVDSINDAGPCTCPSSITCGAIPCADDRACAPGFCIGGFCMDKCGRCTP